jgi:hypothetical protein
MPWERVLVPGEPFCISGAVRFWAVPSPFVQTTIKCEAGYSFFFEVIQEFQEQGQDERQGAEISIRRA